MWFQLYSHTSLYTDEGVDVAKSTIYAPRQHHFRLRKNKDVESPASTSGLTSAAVTEAETKETKEAPEAELETPQMTVWVTICLLAVVTAVSYLLYSR